MPNIKSAKKRVLVSAKKTARNKSLKSALRTQMKKFDAAVAAGDQSQASALLSATVGKVDGAAGKGIIHKNKANRTKAQLAKKLGNMAAE